MGLRLEPNGNNDATAEYVQRTTDLLDCNADYTWGGWVRFQSVDAGYVFSSKSSGGGSYDGLEILYFSGSGTLSIYISNNSGGSTSAVLSTSFSTNVWYHLCLVRNGTSVTAYVNGVYNADASLTVSGGARNATAYMRYSAGYDGFQYGAAEYSGFKAWKLALTEAQIRREMRQHGPVLATSLYETWPHLNGQRAVGYHFGRNWTEINSPADADNAPIAWGGDPDPVQLVTVAGGGAVTATGSMSFLAPGISGNGEVAITGAGTIDIPVMTTTGNSEIPVLGDGILIWPLIQLTGDGKVDIDGSGGFDWPTFQITGTGTIGDVITGDGSISFTIPIITGQGEITVTATGTIDIPVFTLTGQGELGITGQGTLDFPVLISTVGQGEIPITGTSTGPLIWPIFDLVGTGEIGALPTVGFGTLSIPKMALSGSAEVEVSATGTITFPVFAVTTPGATGTLPPYVTVYIWRRMR